MLLILNIWRRSYLILWNLRVISFLRKLEQMFSFRKQNQEHRKQQSLQLLHHRKIGEQEVQRPRDLALSVSNRSDDVGGSEKMLILQGKLRCVHFNFPRSLEVCNNKKKIHKNLRKSAVQIKRTFFGSLFCCHFRPMCFHFFFQFILVIFWHASQTFREAC